MLLHPFSKERIKAQNNENVKKLKHKRTQKTMTQTINDDAYFQERRRKFLRTKTQKKRKAKTQIIGERCQLSSGEYCT